MSVPWVCSSHFCYMYKRPDAKPVKEKHFKVGDVVLASFGHRAMTRDSQHCPMVNREYILYYFSVICWVWHKIICNVLSIWLAEDNQSTCLLNGYCFRNTALPHRLGRHCPEWTINSDKLSHRGTLKTAGSFNIFWEGKLYFIVWSRHTGTQQQPTNNKLSVPKTDIFRVYSTVLAFSVKHRNVQNLCK